MKLMLIAASAAALALSACATDGYGGGRVAYNGYYDDFYGPVYDGYWDDGGVFFYRTGRRGVYLRDNDGHFRRDWDGRTGRYHEFHGMGPHGGPRGGGRHHG